MKELVNNCSLECGHHPSADPVGGVGGICRRRPWPSILAGDGVGTFRVLEGPPLNLAACVNKKGPDGVPPPL